MKFLAINRNVKWQSLSVDIAGDFFLCILLGRKLLIQAIGLICVIAKTKVQYRVYGCFFAKVHVVQYRIRVRISRTQRHNFVCESDFAELQLKSNRIQ